MRRFYLEDFKNGWLFGLFEPTLFISPQVEVAIHEYPKGFCSDGHYHKICTEYNLVLKGKIIVGDLALNKGDGWTYYPGERSNVEFLEDSMLLIIKTPSGQSNDKYY